MYLACLPSESMEFLHILWPSHCVSCILAAIMAPISGLPLPLPLRSPSSHPQTEMLTSSMKSMIRGFVHELMSNPCQLSKIQGDVYARVARLYDGAEVVATFTFVGMDVGITAFHAVYVPEESRIHEDSLRVKIGDDQVKVKHVVSHPHYDISIFKLENALAPKFFDIGFEAINSGDEVFLVSYPAIGEGDYNLDMPVLSHGVISQDRAPSFNNFLVADYQCFPSCSGGAVINKDGKLIGIHVSSNFHEDSSYRGPSRSKEITYSYDCGVVRNLEWEQPAHSIDLEQSSEDESMESSGCSQEFDVSDALNAFASSLMRVRQVALFAAENSVHKGHLASFLPASLVKPLLSLGVAKSPKRRHPSKVKERSPISSSKWEKKLHVICRRLKKSNALKVGALTE